MGCGSKESEAHSEHLSGTEEPGNGEHNPPFHLLDSDTLQVYRRALPRYCPVGQGSMHLDASDFCDERSGDQFDFLVLFNLS